MKKQHRNRSMALEPLEGRRRMDVTLFDGYLGGGNAPVQVTVKLVPRRRRVPHWQRHPAQRVLYPTGPILDALVNAAVPDPVQG